MSAVTQLMTTHPGIKVEISVDQRLTDHVTEHYDAGVRLGVVEQIEKDMVAVKIGPELRMTVVGSPRPILRSTRNPQPPPRPDSWMSASIGGHRRSAPPLRLGVRKE